MRISLALFTVIFGEIPATLALLMFGNSAFAAGFALLLVGDWLIGFIFILVGIGGTLGTYALWSAAFDRVSTYILFFLSFGLVALLYLNFSLFNSVRELGTWSALLWMSPGLVACVHLTIGLLNRLK